MIRPARVRLVLLAVVLLTIAGLAAYFLWPHVDPGPSPVDDPPPPDPRLTFDTPFRNVRPDVAYVGDAACAACHQDIDRSYHQHAMGRSAFVLPAPPGIERFDPPTRPTFTSFGHIDYRIERQGDKVFHVETVKGADGSSAVTTRAEVVIAIGSGTRGRSYLCIRDGGVWQSGISWFGEKQIWDVSPGFGGGRHAMRPILAECLFCHVDRVDPIPGAENRFREPLLAHQASVGCERCHGPGALHVAERTADQRITGAADTSIVNPKRLPVDLREDVCRQCHFQGEHRVVRRGRDLFEYRPGLPLDLFLTVYVPHAALIDYHKSVGQVEHMNVSKCFTGSGGKLGCTSCHDPHSTPAPATKDAFYRGRCMSCHQDKGCSLPLPERQAKNDACAVCHMPKAASANIAHTAVTDHRVPRVPPPPKTGKGSLPPGELPIDTLAGHGKRGPDQAELSRDLGLALAAKIREHFNREDAPLTVEAIKQLTAATDRHPSDAAAWQGLAIVRAARSEWADSLKAAERGLAARPDQETLLELASDAAFQMRKLDAAADYTRRAMSVNPANPDHRVRLAEVLIEESKYVDAAAELRDLLTGCPNHAMARAWLAVCLYQQGQGREALAEVDRAARINPARSDAIRTWFRGRTR
ncbi:MAG TPA: tetratricopeptide repeat protein [Gemmataceae bacterium]|nr:tetratricopeptide repeat protein [Gemmataceae bacterium]